MVGVEKAKYTQKALIYAKNKYKLSPVLVTCDFSPNMTSPIKKVFGEKTLQIDGFHVMQELNNGIRRDIRDYRNKIYQDEIKIFYQLRDWIRKIQTAQCPIKQIKPFPLLPKIKKNHKNCLEAAKTSQIFLNLLNISSIFDFSQKVNVLLSSGTEDDPAILQMFYSKLREKVPKHGFTFKGRIRFENEVLKKLKSFFLAFRKELERKSKSFFKNHWVLFFQPERLTSKRKKKLEAFLAKYPQLIEYRQMTLMVGEIYRRPLEEIDGHQIDDLCIRPYYSDKLKTAIKTLKKNKDSILRFVEVFKRDCTLTRANRTNMEYENRRFKAPFRHGLNCTSKRHLIGKLKLQLTPDVRWFLEDSSPLNIQKI